MLMLLAFGGVALPGEAEERFAEEERIHGEAVAAGGERVLQDVILVLAEVFDDVLLDVAERFLVNGGQCGLLASGRVERSSIRLGGSGLVEEDDLAQDAEAGVHAAFLDEVAELGVVDGRVGLSPLEEVVAHLVGEIDEVELLEIEAALGDGARGLVIIVPREAGDGDAVALEDELVSSADVLVEAVLGIFNEVEELASVEFAPGGHRKAFFAEHGTKAGLGREDLLGGGFGAERDGLFVGADLGETTDRQLSLVLVAEAMQDVDHVGANGVVGVDEGDPFAGGELDTGIAGAGEALVRLMDDLDTAVLLGEDIAKGATHVGGAVVDEDNLEIGVDLLANGLDAALENLGDIVDRDNDGDDWEIFVAAHACATH